MLRNLVRGLGGIGAEEGGTKLPGNVTALGVGEGTVVRSRKNIELGSGRTTLANCKTRGLKGGSG